jgi:uncharacterized GH25 family protein
MRSRAVLLAAALAGAASAARAHDFWIEPSRFHPDPGSTVAVGLRVGQDFRGEPVPRNPALIRRFALVSQGGEAPIDGLPGSDPAGEIAAMPAGLSWIVYRSGASPVTLEAEKFEKYLAEEGLEAVSQARRARSEQDKPGREIFSRSVKAMILSGDPKSGSKGFDRPLGLTLELVLRKDPSRAVPGDLPLRLLSEGKPLGGALVVAMNQAAPDRKEKGRTDARGDVTLRFPQKGVWLVKAVHMTPAPPGQGADWESVWTSLTFEVP